MTDCFKVGKTTNQYRQLCSSNSPVSSTSSLCERDYSKIEQYDEEPTDDDTEIAELYFENHDPDFRRDFSVAHESLRTKTKDKPILRKPISFELFPYVDTTELIQKHIVFSPLEKLTKTYRPSRKNNSIILYYKLFAKRSKSPIQELRKHPTLKQKPCYHATIRFNKFSSNLTLTSCATENLFRLLAKLRWKSVSHYRSFYRSLLWPTLMAIVANQGYFKLTKLFGNNSFGQDDANE